MNPANLVSSGKIRDCAGHADHTMKAASRKPHGRCRISEQLATWLVRGCYALEQFTVGFGVRSDAGAIVPIRLPLSRSGNSAGHFCAALGGRRQSEIGGGDALDIDMEVDAIEKRPGDPRLIIGGALRGTAAGKRRIAEMPASAWVHRCHELNACGKCHMRIGSGDADIARLERLSERIEYGALKFRKLVKEEDPQVGQADFARAHAEASADQRRHGSAVMR
jgi:hypothetical protein